MIGEMIQEYLVGLGAKVDKPGFAEADRTIKAMDRGVETATGHMADNFVKASAAITTALAGVTASVAGLMKATANQDLAMEKLSRQMMVSKQDAYAMKQATDALGESIQDITLTPELMTRFEKLAADGKKMRVGGDFEATMKGFRDLMFEFTRLKQEVSYAMTWVGYYLMKYLNRPLSEARDKFRSFNDAFVRNMSVWTEKAARAIVYIINIGRHLIDFTVDATKHLMTMWDSFPKGVKIAVGALTGLWLVMKASPLGRMIMLVGTLLMLIDDYYGYMEGKQAQFGKYWDKLNEYISIAKEKWEDFKASAMPFWERFIEFLSTAKDKVVEFAHGIGEFLERAKNSTELREFLGIINDLGTAIWNLATVCINMLLEGLSNMREGFSRTSESSGGLSGALSRLWRIFIGLLEVVTDIINFMARLMQEVQRTEEWQEFTEAVGELLGALVELFNAILDLVKVAFEGLFGELGKTGEVYSFRDAIRAVLKIFTMLIKGVTWTIKLFRDLFKMMKDSRPFRLFWETLGRVIDKAIEKVGKFGRALMALTKGDFKGAYNIVTGKSSGGGGSAAGGAAVDRFMAAVSGHESGDTDDVTCGDSGAYGLFQIMPENWPSWAKEAGLPSDAPQTAENQRIVARHKMLEYYNEFGNWRDVAIAWYGGPKAVGYSEEAKNRPQYYNGHEYPSLNAYADDIMKRMGIPMDGIIPDESSGSSGSASAALDKSQWHLWSSTEGMDAPWDSTTTDVSGFQNSTVAFLNYLGKRLNAAGLKGTITGAAEKSGHASGTYSHANGYKVDISDSDIPEGSEFYRILSDAVSTFGGTMNHEWDKGHYDIVIYSAPDNLDGIGNASSGRGRFVSPPLDGVDEELRTKFEDLVNYMNDHGYDVVVQSSSPGSIGFTTTGDDTDPWNIKDNAEDHGLSVSQDEHGWYVSLPTAYTNEGYGIDPLMLRGMRNGMASGGMWVPMVGGGFGGSTVYNVNVGGVTVQGGANASAEDIGKAVGNETMKRLEERGQYILRSRTMAGAPVLV